MSHANLRIYESMSKQEIWNQNKTMSLLQTYNTPTGDLQWQRNILCKKNRLASDCILRPSRSYDLAEESGIRFFFSFSLQALPTMPHILANLVYFKTKFGVVDLQCQSKGHILKERPRRRDAEGIGTVVLYQPCQDHKPILWRGTGDTGRWI